MSGRIRREGVEAMHATAMPTWLHEADDARRWTFDRFRQLGFSWRASVLLAEARADHHQVRRALDNGCSRMHALRIFT